MAARGYDLRMPTDEKILVIEPKVDHARYLRELFSARELLLFFAWRDILVRYKQAFFGIAWALLRPILTMAIFTFLFSRIAAFPSDGVPYSLFALSGMVLWSFFSGAITETTNCLLNNPALITRIYFPRMVIPASMILVQGVDLLVGLALLFGYGIVMGGFQFGTFYLLPLPLLLLFMLSMGTSLIVSSLTVRFRDIRYVIPFFVQIGIYLSPVAYGTMVVPSQWLFLYSLNPLVGIIELFRFALFGVATTNLPWQVALSAGMTMVILWGGFALFRALEPTFGDEI